MEPEAVRALLSFQRAYLCATQKVYAVASMISHRPPPP
jgi:hypothetical protein